MLKRKENNQYIPANIKQIIRYDNPLKVSTDDNGALMRVIQGVWAINRLFRLVVSGNRLIYEGTIVTIIGNKLSFPSEANVTVSGNQLIRS